MIPTNLTRNLGLVKPVRAVAFSPGGRILAAAGDSKVIVLYDTSSGEQIANLSGHSAWVLHSETEKAVWSAKWLPKTARSECFATAGANRSVAFYRESTGG